MFCPSCSAALTTGATSCSTCGALFGEGSAWEPGAAPVDETARQPLGCGSSALAILLSLLSVGFLCLALALKGSNSAVATLVPLLLALIFGASCCTIVFAKQHKTRTAAIVVGGISLAVLILIFVGVVNRVGG
jgi:hypothetical protein